MGGVGDEKSLSGHGPDESWAVRETAAVAVAEPYVVLLEDEPPTQRHLEIVDTTDGGRVVTAIEVLSPANKVGLDGPVAYRRKQREYLEARVNLVEIELVRGGDCVPRLGEEDAAWLDQLLREKGLR